MFPNAYTNIFLPYTISNLCIPFRVGLCCTVSVTSLPAIPTIAGELQVNPRLCDSATGGFHAKLQTNSKRVMTN